MVFLLTFFWAPSPRCEPAAYDGSVDAMLLILMQNGLSETRLERLELTSVKSSNRWVLSLRDNKSVRNVVAYPDGRLSQSTRTTAQSKAESDYWMKMAPVSEILQTLLGQAIIQDARARVAELGLPLTGSYLVRHSARRPKQMQNVPLCIP